MSVGSFLKTGVVVNQAQSFRFYGLEECKKEIGIPFRPLRKASPLKEAEMPLR